MLIRQKFLLFMPSSWRIRMEFHINYFLNVSLGYTIIVHATVEKVNFKQQ